MAGFAQSAPNAVLMAFAEEELKRSIGGRVIDIGCGAGRNALPLARLGWNVVGTDLSWPMLCAAASRTHEHRLDDRLHVPGALGATWEARASSALEYCAFRTILDANSD